ncbi:Eukaryotic aspartyl protease [Aphelenchoides besseyi]|nr:Eukaryotic aspartyl protease [Aphelenchoides besseyi]
MMIVLKVFLLMLLLTSLTASFAPLSVLESKRLEIDDYGDVVYTVNISIGTPPQPFTLKLDTGFAQLIVEELGCAVNPPINPYAPTLPPVHKRQFDPTNSSTLSSTDYYCQLDPWGGGTGSNRFDVIQLGNLNLSAGAFCMLDSTTYEEHHDFYDGILGLGFKDGEEDYLIMPEILALFNKSVFVIWLADRKSQRQEGMAGGLLSFGDLDSEHCDQPWTFVDLSPQQEYEYQWKVNITSVQIGKYSTDGVREARVFSGDSYLTAAASDFHTIIASIGAQFDYRVDEYVVECDQKATLPDLIITIAEREFHISAYEYLFESTAGDGLCNLGVYASGELEDPDVWELSEPFLRAHCVAFDYDKKQIGFLSSKATNSNDFSIPIDSPYAGLYTVNVTLGTPKQTFVVQLDTSIHDFWVVDKSCTIDYCTQTYDSYTKHRYDRDRSTTYQPDGRGFAAEFANGTYAKDNFGIASLSIDGQIFGAASFIYEVLTIPLDGYLGLSWSVDDSIPDVLKGLTKHLESPMFTIFLKPGLLTFDDFDSENCDAQWTTLQLTSDWYWQFDVNELSIGKYSDQRSYSALTYTAEDFLIVPTSFLDQVIRQTGAVFDDYYGLYYVECESISSLPNMTISTKSSNFPLSANQYISTVPLYQERGRCPILILDSDDAFLFDTIVLTQTFLRAYCGAFNWVDRTIAFSRSLAN